MVPWAPTQGLAGSLECSTHPAELVQSLHRHYTKGFLNAFLRTLFPTPESSGSNSSQALRVQAPPSGESQPHVQALLPLGKLSQWLLVMQLITNPGEAKL